ncbi:MAG: DEAD/DEAH box helicase [Ruminococcaceae bacterium]|nr:DEAD/DEAH box helicase [Oscillospiraceae bacterium]
MNYREKAARVYNSFSPFIRDFIYRNEWDTIREVQIEAADVIFSTENNLLICSSTASGKTEAAFFPILSHMYDNPPSSVGVLYIAPLKALINDQFERLETLMEESGISVFHWHGDVPSAQKSKFLKKPTAVLQITPESLESMLINRKNDIPRLFGDLQYVVIDEIHTLMGFDRGSQVCCLIERLSALIGHSPRRIGLSATVGDTRLAAEWLSENTNRRCSVVNIKSSGIKWRLAMQHFYLQNENSDKPTSIDGDVADPGYDFVYKCARQKKSLVFSNSREETEIITATLRQIAESRNEDDIFYIHHGNLSAALRETAESVMKDDTKHAVTCATVTLELGVDIGRLERIINIGAPNTVSSFLQRIGRSGRRETPPEMIMVFREENALPNTPVYELIPWNFLQGIAIIQLYIEERWLEPPFRKSLPFSLLYHQTMSVLASSGELTPASLAQKVLSLAPFKDIEKEDYRDLLVHLIKNEHIQQTEEKGLIIGLKGEKIINSFKFYAVFKDSEDFTVRCKSEEIGTITTPPPVGERFALAGRVWEVEELEIQRKLIYVKAVKGKMAVSWPGDKGEIHTKILKRMKKILEEDTVYPYLKPEAIKRLEKARSVARNTGILETGLVCLGGVNYCLFPWLGTRSVRSLKRFIQYKCAAALGITALEYDSCYYITFKMERYDRESFVNYLNDTIARQGVTLSELVGQNELPVFEKYDEYIPRELLQKSYCTDKLCSEELIARVKELKNEIEKAKEN